MQESVGFLDRVVETTGAGLSTRSTVLRLYAELYRDDGELRAMDRIVRELLGAGRAATETNTRLRALWMVTSQRPETVPRECCDAAYQELREISPEDLKLEDRGEYGLALAYYFFNAGRLSAALQAIRTALLHLEEARINNSILLALRIGEGATLSRLGEYLKGLEASEAAFGLAKKHGNASRGIQAAATSAVCCGRLGNWEAQIRWADTGAAMQAESIDRTFGVKWSLYRLNGEILLGQTQSTDSLLELIDRFRASSPVSWELQMILLYAADLCHLAGQHGRASQIAREATSGNLSKLLAPAHAGRFARWVARLAATNPARVVAARGVLESLMEDRPGLDRLDQAEIVLANRYLSRHEANAAATSRNELETEIDWLPQGARAELAGLGML